MRIKTTPRKTPTKQYSNNNQTFVNPPNFGGAMSPSYRSVSIAATPTKSITGNRSPFKKNIFRPAGLKSATKQNSQNEILRLEELLDLPSLFIDSYMPSVVYGDRPPSGFTSINATPTKDFQFSGVQPAEIDYEFIGKRDFDPVGYADFDDVNEGLRNKLIGWDQLEFNSETLKYLKRSIQLYGQ